MACSGHAKIESDIDNLSAAAPLVEDRLAYWNSRQEAVPAVSIFTEHMIVALQQEAGDLIFRQKWEVTVAIQSAIETAILMSFLTGYEMGKANHQFGVCDGSCHG